EQPLVHAVHHLVDRPVASRRDEQVTAAFAGLAGHPSTVTRLEGEPGIYRAPALPQELDRLAKLLQLRLIGFVDDDGDAHRHQGAWVQIRARAHSARDGHGHRAASANPFGLTSCIALLAFEWVNVGRSGAWWIMRNLERDEWVPRQLSTPDRREGAAQPAGLLPPRCRRASARPGAGARPGADAVSRRNVDGGGGAPARVA